MLDRATLIAGAVTLAAAVPVHLLISALPLPDSFRAVQAPAANAPATASPAAAAAEVRRELDLAPVAAPPPEPAAPVAQVTGRLRTADGTPVPGEEVELASWALETRYVATSDARGRFSIPGVTLGSDYDLKVSSAGRYRALTQHGLAVAAEGLELDLVLQPLAAARLSGRMVDADGAPLSQRTLLLAGSHQQGQALLITGDERGRFWIDRAPTGRLTFTTRRIPLLKVRGPLLAPASEADVLLVLDVGSHELVGRVVGERESPVVGAQLKLSWLHKQGEVISSSARTAVTDASGGFRFTDLGSGPHELTVRADGYEEVRETHRVAWNSGDVELRLRRVGP